MEQSLTASDIDSLRAKGLIQAFEIAIRSGEFIIAENVVTKERRVLNTSGVMLESSRRVLKG